MYGNIYIRKFLYLTEFIIYEQKEHLDSIWNISFTIDSIDMHIDTQV